MGHDTSLIKEGCVPGSNAFGRLHSFLGGREEFREDLLAGQIVPVRHGARLSPGKCNEDRLRASLGSARGLSGAHTDTGCGEFQLYPLAAGRHACQSRKDAHLLHSLDSMLYVILVPQPWMCLYATKGTCGYLAHVGSDGVSINWGGWRD